MEACLGDDQGYKYDVFISYPHGKSDGDIATWVREIFYKHFELCLKNSAIGRDVEIHLDTEVIKPGDKWQPRLNDALARSRILVPILSINYFNSFYCRAEFAVMLHREKELGYWNGEHESSLIVPVHLWGVRDTFPKIVREYQLLDCQDYSCVLEGSALHMEFKERVKQWMPDLSERIKSAPKWDSAWRQREWVDDPIEQSEQSRLLWPPNAVFSLESMG